jgi:hypothetical protein
MPAFTLNSAVDELLKREFDQYRMRRQPHPLMVKFGIDAVPYVHPMLDEWREPFKGIACHHEETGLIIFGAVDDLWISPKGEIYVVDYKATSTTSVITLDSEYRQAYKRQIEIYQWLLRCQPLGDLTVSNTGYFVYCNADKLRPVFDARLDFYIDVMPYEGDDSWVDKAVREAQKCLAHNKLPPFTPTCQFCQYLQATDQVISHNTFSEDQIDLFE